MSGRAQDSVADPLEHVADVDDDQFGVRLDWTPALITAEDLQAMRIPWNELAFPVIRMALEVYLEDRKSGQTYMHFGVARWSGEGNPYHYSEYELSDHVVS